MTSRAPRCPLCGQPADPPHTLVVCGECHGSLHGEVALRNTAEFSVDQLLADGSRLAAPAVAVDGAGAPAPAPRAVHSAWCGRTPEQVRRVLSHGDAHICDQCVALCHEILEAERDG